MKIHSAAIVDPAAKIGADVEIGPYSVVGPSVKVGDKTIIQSHVILEGDMTIGTDNFIGHGAIIGSAPQDLGFSPERKTRIEIGNDNVFREYCTIHRGSPEGSATRIGDKNFLMVGVHVGHNCEIGNNVIIANNCLLARRLVERGVRAVQIYYGASQPWDTHDNNDGQHRNLARGSDQAIAGLLQDLKQRGLLDETIVLWGGEFGRTPASQGGTGRDHNHWGFSLWLAGGGFKGGMAYGATDEFGFRAEQNRMHVHDLHATILHQMGLDHERLTYRYSGRDHRLTDVSGRVIRDLLV